MKRKTTRAVDAIDKPRRHSFLKTALKRAITTAQATNLPVARVDIGNDGNVSLIIGKPTSESDNDLMTTINERQLKELI